MSDLFETIKRIRANQPQDTEKPPERSLAQVIYDIRRAELHGLSPEEREYIENQKKVGGPVARSVAAKYVGLRKQQLGKSAELLSDTDILAKENIHVLPDAELEYVPPSTVTMPVKNAVIRQTAAGVVKGLLAPISAFLPDYYTNDINLELEKTRMATKEWLDSLPNLNPYTPRDALAATPGFIGEQAGYMIPATKAYMVARKAFGVPKAVSIAGKAIKSIAAGASTGGVLSLATKLQDGESRWARVAMDAAIAGAFETVALPLFRKAFMQELGEANARAAMPEMARAMGVSTEQAAERVARVRAGVPDMGAAAAVREVGARNRRVANSPLGRQAEAQLQALDRLMPETIVVDPALSRNAFQLSYELNGEATTMTVDWALDQNAALRQLMNFRNLVANVARHPKMSLQIKEVYAGRQDVIDRVLAFIGGDDWVRAAKSRVAQRATAAPKNTVAETGQVKVGDHVTYVSEDGQRLSGTVTETAAVPFVVTREHRQALADLGYSSAEVNTFTPEQVQAIISSNTMRSAAATAPVATVPRYEIQYPEEYKELGIIFKETTAAEADAAHLTIRNALNAPDFPEEKSAGIKGILRQILAQRRTARNPLIPKGLEERKAFFLRAYNEMPRDVTEVEYIQGLADLASEGVEIPRGLLYTRGEERYPNLITYIQRLSEQDAPVAAEIRGVTPEKLRELKAELEIAKKEFVREFGSAPEMLVETPELKAAKKRIRDLEAYVDAAENSPPIRGREWTPESERTELSAKEPGDEILGEPGANTNPRPGDAPPGFITVARYSQMKNKTVYEQVRLDKVQVKLVQPRNPNVPYVNAKPVYKSFVAHSDGSDRIGYVDLQHRIMGIEGVDQKDAWLRGTPEKRDSQGQIIEEAFGGYMEVEKNGDAHRAALFFAHQDGSLTFSIVPVDEKLAQTAGVGTPFEALYAGRSDSGPLDIVDAIRGTRYNSEPVLRPAGRKESPFRPQPNGEFALVTRRGKRALVYDPENQFDDAPRFTYVEATNLGKSENVYWRGTTGRPSDVGEAIVGAAGEERQYRGSIFPAGWSPRWARKPVVPQVREKLAEPIPEFITIGGQRYAIEAVTDPAELKTWKRATAGKQRAKTKYVPTGEDRAEERAASVFLGEGYSEAGVPRPKGTDYVWRISDLPPDLPQNRQLGLDEVWHPARVTQKRIAQLMIDEGWDPETPVRTWLAKTRHEGHADQTADATLRSLADWEEPLVGWNRVARFAESLGWRALAEGPKARIIRPDGTATVYNSWLGAIEGMSVEVGKQNHGPDLLAKAKAAMNMGADRMYDPRFDSNAYVPSNVVEAVLTQVGMGRHPGVEILTEDARFFEEALAKTMRWQPLTTKAIDVLELTSPEPHGIMDEFYGDSLVRGWLRRRDGISGNQGRFFVYDADQMWARLTGGTMPARLAELGISFEQQIKDRVTGKVTFERRTLKEILGRIADLEGGVEILTSPDPESAAIYAWLRMYGMKEQMRRAGVIATPYGNFPEFDAAFKQKFRYRVC